MANQDTPVYDGWPIASSRGALIQESPIPKPGVVSNDNTNAPGGLHVAHAISPTAIYPSQEHG